jgi:hypothetical protein
VAAVRLFTLTVAVSIGSIIALAVIALNYNWTDAKTSSPGQVEADNTLPVTPTTGATDTEAQPSQLLSLTRQYLARRMSTPRKADMSLPETTPPPLTEKEQERLSRLARVRHIYWSRGRLVLDEMLSEESRDPEWQDTVSQSASAMLKRAEFLGTELKNVACGSTLCKIEFHHEDRDAFQRFDSSGGMDNQNWLGHDFGIIKRLGDETDSPMETTMFFAHDNSPYDVMVDRLIEILEQEAT